MSAQPHQNEKQTGIRRRREGELTAAESAVINDKLREIEAMNATGKLAKRRLAFRRSLDEAEDADHSAASRRVLAAKQAQEAKELRTLIERIERAQKQL